MKPHIALPVHYRSRGSADGVFPPECRAALVTKVHAPVMSGDTGYRVDLATLSPTGLHFDMAVPYNEDMEPGTWHDPRHDEFPEDEPPDPEHVHARPVTP